MCTFGLHVNLTTSTFGITGAHLRAILLLQTFFLKNMTIKNDCDYTDRMVAFSPTFLTNGMDCNCQQAIL